MSTNSILQYFIPKDRKFFPLFEQAAANLVVIAKTLQEALAAPPEKRGTYIRQIEKLEHVGDEITHQIFQEVGTTFITPFDREDIQRLASVLDDILDYIHGSAKRIELYKVDVIHPAMYKLRNLRKIGKIREACVRINSIENHADDIFDNAVARLFEDQTDAVEIIKIKEILSALETATDKAEDAANVLESIIIKFS